MRFDTKSNENWNELTKEIIFNIQQTTIAKLNQEAKNFMSEVFHDTMR